MPHTNPPSTLNPGRNWTWQQVAEWHADQASKWRQQAQQWERLYRQMKQLHQTQVAINWALLASAGAMIATSLVNWWASR